MGNCWKTCMGGSKKGSKSEKNKDKKNADDKKMNIEGSDKRYSSESERVNLNFDDKDAQNVKKNENPDIEAQENNIMYESDVHRPFDPRSSVVTDSYKKKMLSHLNTDNLEGVQNLLENGFPVNIPLGGDGFTALHYAAKRGNVKIMEILLKNSADIDVVDDKENWTPLMKSCLNGKLASIIYLLENGANPSKVSEDGKTALDYLREAQENFETIEEKDRCVHVMSLLEEKMKQKKEEENNNNNANI